MECVRRLPCGLLKLIEAISKQFSLSNSASDEIVNQVKNHLQSVLSDALNKNILQSNVTTKQTIKIFREKKIIKMSIAELESMGILLDYTNKVFREVKRMGRWYIEPSSPAVSLIISENVKNCDDVFKLRDKLFESTCEKIKS